MSNFDFQKKVKITAPYCGGPAASLQYTVRLTGPVGQQFASRLGGSSSRPRSASTLTMEPGSPVSNVLLRR
jgi:hypothetical protein